MTYVVNFKSKQYISHQDICDHLCNVQLPGQPKTLGACQMRRHHSLDLKNRQCKTSLTKETETEKQRNRDKETETKKQRQRNRDEETEIKKQRQRNRDKETETKKQRQRNRDKETETKKQR